MGAWCRVAASASDDRSIAAMRRADSPVSSVRLWTTGGSKSRRADVNLHGQVGDLVVPRELLVDLPGGERGIVCHETERAGISAFPDSPDVQVGNLRVAPCESGFDVPTDRRDHRLIHFPVQQ